jgi:diguanylate cyclase (GGDEF)-like protein
MTPVMVSSGKEKESFKKEFKLLSKEIIKCLHDISSKKLHLDTNVLSSLLLNNSIITNIFAKNINELEKSLRELRHWRYLYLDNKNKCVECNKDHYEKERLLRKIILLIDNIVVSSLDAKVNKELKEISKALSKSPDQNTLNSCIAKLNSFAKKHKIEDVSAKFDKKLKDVEKADEIKPYSEIVTEVKKDIFSDIMNRIRIVLPNVAKDIKEVESKIGSKFAAGKPSRFIDELANLVYKQNCYHEKEKEELKKIILMLLNKLKETEKIVTFTIDMYNKKVKGDSKFHNNLSNEVNDIENSFDLIDEDVVKFKRVIKKKVKEITGNIKDKIEKDLVQTKEISSELQVLKDKVEKANEEVEQYKEKAKTLEVEANTDPLIGIPNRRAIDSKLKDEHQRFERYGRPCSVLVCDLDYFKEINDKYGHVTGDNVLKKVAYIIKKNLRECDFFGRYGGDEFIVVLPDTDSDKGEKTAEKLRDIVGKSKFLYQKEEVSIEMSVGISQFLEKDDYSAVFKRADKALYKAKSSGRNMSVKYSDKIAASL